MTKYDSLEGQSRDDLPLLHLRPKLQWWWCCYVTSKMLLSCNKKKKKEKLYKSCHAEFLPMSYVKIRYLFLHIYITNACLKSTRCSYNLLTRNELLQEFERRKAVAHKLPSSNYLSLGEKFYYSTCWKLPSLRSAGNTTVFHFVIFWHSQSPFCSKQYQ